MKHSLILALLFWSLLALALMIEDIFYVTWAQTSGFAVSSALAATVLSLAWVLIHAKENDVRTPMLLNVAIVAVPFVAVPYYRFRYFGAKSGFKFVGWILMALVALVSVLTLIDNSVNGVTAA